MIDQQENECIGHPLTLPKQPTHTRIHFQNINGINVTNTNNTWTAICEHWRDMEVDIALANEHKLDTTKPYVTTRLHEGAQRILGYNNFHLVATSTPVSAYKFHKPGGVLAAVIGNTKGKLIDSGQDDYGRWIHLTFQTPMQPVTIVCTYQVIDRQVHQAGDTTYDMQLFSLYTKHNRQEPHRLRKHHSQDLVAFVQSKLNEGHRLVVAGDFNETLGENPDGMSKLCSHCGLVDPIIDTHQVADFKTYLYGSKVLDYFLVSPELLPAIHNCGYEPFKVHINSDHRGVYIDIDTASFLGANIPPLAPMPNRDIQSKKAHQIAPYFNNKHQHLIDHGWFQKIELLQDRMLDDSPDHDLAEDLYRRLHGSCVYAGRRLRKFPKAPYSPTIARLRNIMNLMRMAVSNFTSPVSLQENIDHLQEKLGSLRYEVPATLDECKQQLQAVQKEFKTLLLQELTTRKLRCQLQDTLLQQYQQEGNSKMAKKLRQIKRAEEVSHVYRKLDRIRKPFHQGGLSHLLVPEDPNDNPKTCTSWRRVDDPDEIQALLQERNAKHFGQSKQCTLTKDPTDFTMKFTGACHEAEAILNGTYDTANLEPMTQLFLDALQYVTDPDTVTSGLTLEEYKGKLKVWDERTSTSPGTNMHLGHLKAYWADHNLPPDSDEADELEEKRAAILSGHLTLLNYALQFGYSYHSWKMVVNAMLEKETGNPKIHRLRVIHLYEADYNLILSVKWRALLSHACNNGMVNASNFGSQPGKEAIDAVFVKELELELSKMTRTQLLHFDNDATSCYDRIPCFLANVVSRKYGMNRKVCIVQGNTLAQARYHLKTRLGVSEDYVTHTFECPWFGTGQGSGNSPMVWLFICSTLFDINDKISTGALWASPDGSWKVNVLAIGFVDDVRNSSNQFGQHPQPPLDDLIAQATKDSQNWHDLLEVSNQELELPKCSYQVMQYDFADDGEPSLVEKSNCQLSLQNKQGDTVNIKHVPTTEAVKYLGCHTCPANNHTQMEELLKKANKFAKQVNCSRLTRRETQCMYWAIYKTSVGYALPMCHFTKEELDKIQAKAHVAMLTKSGYNRFTPTAVVYGPHYLGGAGFYHLYDDQGYGQVRAFLKFWRSPGTETGKLLRITVSWAQYCSGISHSLLEHPEVKLPYLESRWLQSLRQYLADVQGTIQLYDAPVAQRQREGDLFLMDVAIANGFKPAELRRVNYCRMYLNVLLLSDIVTPCGKFIDPAMYVGDFTATMSTSKDHRVYQKKPGAVAWKQWRRLIHIICGSRTKKLEHPLGAWIIPISQQRRQWPFMYDPDSNKMFCPHDELGYTRHKQMYHDYDEDRDGIVLELPPTTVPAGIKRNKHSWTLKGWEPLMDPIPPATPTSVLQLIETLEEWEKMLFVGLNLLVSEEELWAIMSSETCLICSDGAADKETKKGSFGWIISTSGGRRLVTCNGPAYSFKPNSYRAEGYGILSALRFWHHLQQLHSSQHIQPPKHTAHCDNKSMVQVIRKHSKYHQIYPNATLAAEWDIIAECRTTMLAMDEMARPSLQHIQGHQDTDTEYQDLPLAAQLNVDADALAGQFLRDHPEWDHSKVPIMPTSGAQLNLPQGTVTYNLRLELQHARTVPPLKEKLMHRCFWIEEDYNDVNWTAHSQALKRHHQHRVTMVKYLNDVLPIGELVHKYNVKYSDKCPSCQNPPVETRHHFLHCPAPARVAWRQQFMSALRAHLESLHTADPLQTLMLEGMKCVFDDAAPSTINIPPGMEELAQAQFFIGWNQMLKGRFSNKWTELQDHHLGDTATHRTNGQTWLTSVVDFIFQEWWKLWKLRNDDRHGRDAQTKAQLEHAQAIRELTLLYEAYSHTEDPRLSWLFDVPLATRIQTRSTSSMRQWLNQWEPVLRESYKTSLETG